MYIYNRYLFFCSLQYLVNIINCEEIFNIQQNKRQILDYDYFNVDRNLSKLSDLSSQTSEFDGSMLQSENQQLNRLFTIKQIAEKIDLYYDQIKQISKQAFGNIHFRGNIILGKNNIQFLMLFDTGSNNLWVAEQSCSQCKFGQNKYKCNNKKCTQNIVNIKYDWFEYVKGYIANDEVTIQGKTTTLQFISVLEMEYFESFELHDVDGVLGLGADRDNCFVNQLFREKKIERNMFSIKLSNNIKNKEDTNEKITTELQIGGYDKNVIGKSINIKFYDVVCTRFWAIQMNGAFFYNNEIFFLESDLRVAIFDSSSSVIEIPEKDYFTFLKYLLLKFECNDVSGIQCKCKYGEYKHHPTQQIKFIDKRQQEQIIKILPKNYITFSEGRCSYQIVKQTSPDFQNVWILGSPFMSQTYNIFNYERNQVGIFDLEGNYGNENTDRSEDGIFDGFSGFFILIIVIGISIYLSYLVYQKYIKELQLLQQQKQNQNIYIPLNNMNGNMS